jgi:hypothetical protein
MLVLEEKERGKSWFLKRLLNECETRPSPVPVVLLDFDQRVGGLIDHASVAHEVRRWLGDASTPAISALEDALDRSRAANGPQTGEEDTGRMGAGRALYQDLVGFSKRAEYVVLLLDTFEHASTDLCAWLECWLFDRLRHELSHVLLVIAGRPEKCRAFFARPLPWRSLITSITFDPFSDDDLRAYYRKRNLEIAPPEESLYMDLARLGPARMSDIGDLLEQARGTGR